MGWILGRRFLRLTHVGRVTGGRYQTILEVVAEDPEREEVFVIAGLGRSADWYRNLPAGNAAEVAIACRRLAPSYRDLDPLDASAVIAAYERCHRLIAPLIQRILSRLFERRYIARDAGRLSLPLELPIIAFRAGEAEPDA